MYNINDQLYMLESIGTFWRMLPEADQQQLLTVWQGYTHLAADYYAFLYQTDYSKSLQDIQSTEFKLWERIDLWKYDNFEEESSILTYRGEGEDTFVWDSTEQGIDCTFKCKGSYDQVSWPLRYEVDQWANLHWQATIRPTSTGPGGLVGYFNRDNLDLTDTLAFGWANNSIFALACDSNGVLTHTLAPSAILELETDYIITGTYIATGGQLTIDCFDSNRSLLQSFTHSINPPDYPILTGIYTIGNFGVSGNYLELNNFCVSNINSYNHVDSINTIVGSASGSSTAIITNVGYFDPSVESSIQDIPTLQTEIENPILTLTEGVSGDYQLIGQELYFHSLIPAVYLWAPKVYYDNMSVAYNFGYPVNYRILDKVHTDAEYLDGIKGLWHSYVYGATISNLETGLAVLARQPFVSKKGTITAIEAYDGTYSRVSFQPEDGSELQYYFYETSIGLAVNPETNATYAVGDLVDKFKVLSDALQVVDIYTASNWWTYHLISDASEIQKYKSFGVRLKPLALSANSLSLMVGSFINHVKPVDTRAWFMKEDDTPLFLFDIYTHSPYVNVNIIGNQNVYLPADFVFDSRRNIFYYGEAAITDTSVITPVPAADGAPIVVLYDMTTSSVTYSYTPSSIITSGASIGSQLYCYGQTAFLTRDDGVTWSRILDFTTLLPCTLEFGNKFSTDYIGYMGEYYSFVCGLNDTRMSAGIVFSYGGQAYVMSGEVPTDLDILGGSEAPYDFRVLDYTMDDLTTATGSFLLAGIRESVQSQLVVYKGDVTNRVPEEIMQLSDIYTINIGDSATTIDFNQTIYLTSTAPNGISFSYLMHKTGSPGSLYIDIYTGDKFDIEDFSLATPILTVGPVSGITENLQYIVTALDTEMIAGTYTIRLRATGDSSNYYTTYGGTKDSTITGLGYSWTKNDYDRANYVGGSATVNISRTFGDLKGQAFTVSKEIVNPTIKFRVKPVDPTTFDPTPKVDLNLINARIYTSTVAVSGDPILRSWTELNKTDSGYYVGVPKKSSSYTELSVTLTGVTLSPDTWYCFMISLYNNPGAGQAYYLEGNNSVYNTEGHGSGYACGAGHYDPGAPTFDRVSPANTDMLFFITETDPDLSIATQITTPFVVPSDYVTLTEISTIDMLNDFDLSDLTESLSNNLELIKVGTGVLKILAPDMDSDLVYMYDTVDGGVTWTPSSFTVTTNVAAVSLRRLYYKDGIYYCYFKEANTSFDYIVASNDEGVTWSTPILVSTSTHSIHPSIRPSFLTDADGETFLLGVSSSGTILIVRKFFAS